MEGLVVLPATHHGVGEQTRAGEAARDRQLRRLGDQHRRGPVPDAVLGHELRADHPHDDGGGGPALEDFAHLLADALVVLEPLALHVEGDELDLHPREMLGEGLAARRLPPLMLAHRLSRRGRGRRLAQQHVQEGERELALIAAQAFGLLPEEAALELLILLAQEEVELAVFVALRLGARAHQLVGKVPVGTFLLGEREASHRSGCTHKDQQRDERLSHSDYLHRRNAWAMRSLPSTDCERGVAKNKSAGGTSRNPKRLPTANGRIDECRSPLSAADPTPLGSSGPSRHF